MIELNQIQQSIRMLTVSVVADDSDVQQTDVTVDTLFQKETSTFRFIFGPSTAFVDSSAVSHVTRFVSRLTDKAYEPYKKRGSSGQFVQLDYKSVFNCWRLAYISTHCYLSAVSHVSRFVSRLTDKAYEPYKK